MLDIEFIRDHQDEVRKAIKNKNLELDFGRFLKVDEERREFLKEIEELKREKNTLNTLVTQAKDDKEREESLTKGKAIKEKLDEIESRYKKVEQEFDELMAKMPTVPSPDTPVGESDAENKEISHWGEKKDFSFSPRTHIELGELLDILDLERGVKVAGYRGYYLKNEGALLVMGLMQYALQKMVSHGYAPFLPPTLIRSFPLFGSGYFKGLNYDPKVDEIYEIATRDVDQEGKENSEKKFLVGTAEPSLLAYYSGEVLDGKTLPMKLAGFSQCYRSEIGSYGKDTKGMYRVHEFMKVEQVILASADIEQANKLQEEMLSLSEGMHEELGLPYRKLQICTGDMGVGKYRMFDLEAWMPGLGRYGETGSASNFLDWQARRLNVKYRDAVTGEKKFVYMLNNTALPSPRVLIAIMENYQQEDGSVTVPEVLRPFVGKDVIKPREK